MQESRRLNRRRAWLRVGPAVLLVTVAVTAASAGGSPSRSAPQARSATVVFSGSRYPALGAGSAEGPPTPATFDRDVRPLLGRHCAGCHGARDQHGGLRLDSYDAVMRGGDSGPVVLAGDAGNSLLVAKIEHRDRPVMPPRKRLPVAAIARIRTWITSGAAP